MSESEELKKIYRKAIGVCHPDRAPAHLRPFLETKAKELNAAYDAGSLKRVRQIASELGVLNSSPQKHKYQQPEAPGKAQTGQSHGGGSANENNKPHKTQYSYEQDAEKLKLFLLGVKIFALEIAGAFQEFKIGFIKEARGIAASKFEELDAGTQQDIIGVSFWFPLITYVLVVLCYVLFIYGTSSELTLTIKRVVIIGLLMLFPGGYVGRYFARRHAFLRVLCFGALKIKSALDAVFMVFVGVLFAFFLITLVIRVIKWIFF